ncbi:MAG: AI-2E family transporter [Christensenellaceae bacterium]|jgi:predicted PurR-regulated permease PerM|nr:AI-2E family transporter [Christensenellaceae bacterium]
MRKKSVLVLLLGVILIFCIFNFNKVLELSSMIWNALKPVFVAILFVLAFNTPVSLLEKLIKPLLKHCKLRRIISVFLVLGILSGLIILFILIVAPDIEKSINSLGEKINAFATENYNLNDSNMPFIKSLLDKVTSLSGNVLNSIASLSTRLLDMLTVAVSAIVKTVAGIGLGILALIHKEALSKQAYHIIKHFKGRTVAIKSLAIISAAGSKFSRFLTGQSVESVIFGLLCYLSFIIFKIPHPGLLSFILAVGNIFPIIGAYVAGISGFLFVLAEKPNCALVFLLIVIIVQQIEQLTTYPLVVGKYMDLSGFWTFFSVTIGGGLLGLVGLLLSVPTASFLKQLFSAIKNSRANNVRLNMRA